MSWIAERRRVFDREIAALHPEHAVACKPGACWCPRESLMRAAEIARQEVEVPL
ncbi:hypothetical protein Pan2_78 [Pseudanabaena phage Pan2]|nr:hypothetical protein Pan2_78 [Pseudanabaena phage Pan2]